MIRKLKETDKKIIASSQEWKCNICKSIFSSSYQIDHIVPFSVSENDSYENLQALCSNCHSCKTQKEYSRIYQYKKLCSIINKKLCWFCLEENIDHINHKCLFAPSLKLIKIPSIEIKKLNILDKYYYTENIENDVSIETDAFCLIDKMKNIDLHNCTLHIHLLPKQICYNRSYYIIPKDYTIDEIVNGAISFFNNNKITYNSVEVEIDMSSEEDTPDELVDYLHTYLPEKMPAYIFKSTDIDYTYNCH